MYSLVSAHKASHHTRARARALTHTHTYTMPYVRVYIALVNARYVTMHKAHGMLNYVLSVTYRTHA